MGAYTFTEDHLVIPLGVAGQSASAAKEFESFNMRAYDQATLVFLFSATLGAGANVLTLESGSADGTDTADVTFHYRYGKGTIAGASADLLTVDATASTLSLTASTYENHLLVLEVHADELRKSGEVVYPWITPDIDGTGSSGCMTGVAILSKPRYADSQMNTAI